MTFIEKYMKAFPEADPVKIMMYHCPARIGFERFEDMPCGGDEAKENCKECWNREVRNG